MPQVPQISKPKRINLDVSKKYISPEEAFYMLNNDSLTVPGKSIPMPANIKLCSFDDIAGDTYTIGVYHSPLTNEVYVFNFNTLGNHFIYRVTSEGCEIVYSGECLNFSADPKHSIENWRVSLDIEKICTNRHGKRLIWVDGNIESPGCIDVEASILTNNFTTDFFDVCPHECAPVQLCVPKPCGCIEGEFIPLAQSPIESALTNQMLKQSFMFAFQQIYYDGREGDISEISTLFYQDAISCFDSAEGFPRCLKLTIPLGNPLVDKVRLIVSKDNGRTWETTDIIEKYESYSATKNYWYERDLSPSLDLTDDGCSFYYYYCNDKQCASFSDQENNVVGRVYNPIPRQAQGLIPIKNSSLGFYNYIQGNCPLDKAETEKLTVDKVCEADECEIEYATIVVRAVVHNLRDNTNQFVYRLGGNADDPDDTSDTAYFGGLEYDAVTFTSLFTTFDQNFNGKIREFKPYIEEAQFFGEMTQFRATTGFVGNAEVGVIAGMSQTNVQLHQYALALSGVYFYSEYTFKVKKGLKGVIRMQSHIPTGNDADTSTFVAGTVDITQYTSQVDLDGLMTESKYEIAFDTCDGDVDLTEAFVIQDHAEEAASAGFFGYITDLRNNPCEGLQVGGAPPYVITDHNGFWHFTVNDPDSDTFDIDILGEQNCSTFTVIQSSTLNAIEGGSVSKDIQLTDETYADDYYALVEGDVIDCDGNPVGGVPIAITGSKGDITDADGHYSIRIRNYESRDREVTVYLMDKNNCYTVDCDGTCNPCLPSGEATTPPCYQHVSGAPTVDIGTFTLARVDTDQSVRGLKKGGRYGWAAVVKWPCGKISAAYPINFLDIPKLQEDSKAAYCTFTYDGTGMILPEGSSCLDIVRTINLNPYELQWVVDKIENTTGGKIRLTIQSLGDYNAEYTFKTNTKYQFLEGDRIEFIRNGDGSILTINQYGLLNYATISPFNDITLSNNSDADYFNQLLIDDDGKLNDITEGAVIELQRAKDCVVEPTYYGICVSIPVVQVDNGDGTTHGELSEETGTFTTFDTYKVSRIIGKFYPQFFEHKYPSDFWSSGVDGGISDIGRSYFENDFENERRYGRNITINAGNVINFFGELVHTLEGQEHGDIIAMTVNDGKIAVAIGEYDNTMLLINDDLLRQSADGLVRASSPNNIIGGIQPNVQGKFGLRYEDIGSVFFGDSYVKWFDVKRIADVLHNYSVAVDVSIDRMKTYYRRRFQEIQYLNSIAIEDVNKYRFCVGRNKLTGAISTTIKALSEASTNNSTAPFVLKNETVLYHPERNEYLTFASWTPEFYSTFDDSGQNGSQMIMFYLGEPYVVPVNVTVWNSFFGVACDWVIGFAINVNPNKIKRPVSCEIQSETAFFAKEVTTDTPNFLSEVPAVRIIKSENKWNFSFLSDKNSTGGLYGKSTGRGYFISVLLLRDNTLNLAYNSVDTAKQVAYSELDELITKVSYSEQSGYDNNL